MSFQHVVISGRMCLRGSFSMSFYKKILGCVGSFTSYHFHWALTELSHLISETLIFCKGSSSRSRHGGCKQNRYGSISHSDPLFLLVVWRLRAGAQPEEAERRSILGADLSHRGRVEEAAPHRPQHVLSCRPGAHQSCQDQILTGISMCLKPTH